MATSGDPWRILGLAPGAGPDEVRRAYRKLAKANHPDAAGEAALPRFLAIQAAYEQLAGPGRARRPGARPGSSAGPPPSPREPWRADPDRARASGRADGRRPGARPAGRSGGGEAQDGGGRGATGGGAASGAAPGPGPSRPGSSRPRRPSSRRAPKTATPYSTSYDAADEEPFEPGWSGGTWYGASSGTYWTINPKEYADPRKHGPEYQARARRAATGSSAESAADPAPAGPEVDPAGRGRDPGPDDSFRAEAPAEPDEPTVASAGASDAARPRATAWTAAAGGHPGSDPRSRGVGEPWFGAGPPDIPEDPSRSTTADDPARFRGPMLPRATTPTGRLAIALLGWPPLALFVAAAIGESTGCGRYAASCSEVSSPGTWIVAVAILLLLLALPAVATWSAHGSIATLVVGVPSAIVLSAAGGTNLPGASAPIMLAVLAVAYLAGLAYGLVVPRLSPPA